LLRNNITLIRGEAVSEVMFIIGCGDGEKQNYGF